MNQTFPIYFIEQHPISEVEWVLAVKKAVRETLFKGFRPWVPSQKTPSTKSFFMRGQDDIVWCCYFDSVFSYADLDNLIKEFHEWRLEFAQFSFQAVVFFRKTVRGLDEHILSMQSAQGLDSALKRGVRFFEALFLSTKTEKAFALKEIFSPSLPETFLKIKNKEKNGFYPAPYVKLSAEELSALLDLQFSTPQSLN